MRGLPMASGQGAKVETEEGFGVEEVRGLGVGEKEPGQVHLGVSALS